ncbi:epoxide hydrolase [Auriculariales sp. MPI-PUGE-AT-0066]|nr:epoxide hydrolase [Auriculariales sp. MPI-PUGE-AT-0066]
MSLESPFPYFTAKLSTGRTLGFVDQAAVGVQKAVMLCIHGFPDFSYGWRHQIVAWSAMGYRVVAPDTLGYGQSDKPRETAAYKIKAVVNDLAALLDHLNVPVAIVLGHDWGAMIAWRFVQWHPERTLGLVTLSIPYYPPPAAHIALEEAAKRVPNFGYQVWFGNEQSTEVIEANLDTFFALLFQKPRPSSEGSIALLGELEAAVTGRKSFANRPLLSKEELDHYVAVFKKGGMHGPLSYYRTGELNVKDYAELPTNLPAEKAILFIWGTEDFSCSERAVKSSRRFAPQMEQVRVEGCGHWLMVEAKDLVIERVAAFAKSLVEPSAKL